MELALLRKRGGGSLVDAGGWGGKLVTIQQNAVGQVSEEQSLMNLSCEPQPGLCSVSVVCSLREQGWVGGSREALVQSVASSAVGVGKW